MPLDITSFTTPFMLVELGMAKQRGALQVTEPGTIGVFTAVALTDAVPVDGRFTGMCGLDSDELGAWTLQSEGHYTYRGEDFTRFFEGDSPSKYIVRAKIIGDSNGNALESYNNPHNGFENPCSLATSADYESDLEKVCQYTLFISGDGFSLSRGATISKDDIIQVGLVMGDNNYYDLEQGILVSLFSRNTIDSSTEPTSSIGCTTLASLFVSAV